MGQRVGGSTVGGEVGGSAHTPVFPWVLLVVTNLLLNGSY